MTYVSHSFSVRLLVLALASALLVLPSFASPKAQTFTGKVSDAMCGAQHGMGGNGADCTRACVSKGSNYALVVGDKVYTLETKDKASLSTLDKLADKTAKVTGTADGDTITVQSVAPGQ